MASSIFRINNNALANSSFGNLSKINQDFAKSVNKLSTGQDINSSVDNPAGYIQVQSFRSQIGGIEQAISNSQQAVNYAQTANSALDEVVTLLQNARGLALSSANSATMTSTQIQANQAQLNSIVASVNGIAQNTTYGTIHLLDGSSGTYGVSTSGSNVSNISFTGSFNGNAINQNSTISVQVTTAADQASVAGTATFAAATSTVTTGSFTINGVTFSTSSGETISELVSAINNASKQTGVTAEWTAGGGVTLTSVEYGSAAKLDLVDSSGVLLSSSGSSSATGTDAVGVVNVTLASGVSTATFNSGSGLTLKDNYGNSIELTTSGNVAGSAAAWGAVVAGNATFQTGANINQTSSLSLQNFASSSLGTGIVTGLNLSNISLNTQANATSALQVIDQAITQVTTAQSDIGNFVQNNIESTMRSLSVAKESIQASQSNIRDVDLAEELTNFAKLQIMQNAALSMLSQANSAPQSVLKLLQ